MRSTLYRFHMFLMGVGVVICFYGNSVNQIQGLNPIRRLLCHLRGGDYVHPGDAGAIDLVVNQCLQFDSFVTDKALLDVGCGFGGTVHYIAQKGFLSTSGIDLDATAISYAQATYPQYHFITGNALQADQYFQEKSFGCITLFSVMYAISDKRTLLTSLACLAQSGTILAIWDYTRPNSEQEEGLRDANNKPMYPIVFDELKRLLHETGWDLLLEQDMSSYFFESYKIILNQLHTQNAELVDQFTLPVVTRVQEIYANIYKDISFGKLGGIMILARKR